MNLVLNKFTSLKNFTPLLSHLILSETPTRSIVQLMSHRKSHISQMKRLDRQSLCTALRKRQQSKLRRINLLFVRIVGINY